MPKRAMPSLDGRVGVGHRGRGRVERMRRAVLIAGWTAGFGLSGMTLAQEDAAPPPNPPPPPASGEVFTLEPTIVTATRSEEATLEAPYATDTVGQQQF